MTQGYYLCNVWLQLLKSFTLLQSTMIGNNRVFKGYLFLGGKSREMCDKDLLLSSDFCYHILGFEIALFSGQTRWR